MKAENENRLALMLKKEKVIAGFQLRMSIKK